MERAENHRVESGTTGDSLTLSVLCREEAMVYLENYLRGSRVEDDMRALRDYLVALPENERGQVPVDHARLLGQLVGDLTQAAVQK